MPQTAKIIADSISPDHHRLTTMELRYPKFIHGEFMTHRTFSRNASSSRAIPTAKLIEEVRAPSLMAKPAKWVKNEPGMQGYTELTGAYLDEAIFLWEKAGRWAANMAENMLTDEIHKQIINRILDPFIHIKVVATATDAGWLNFFGLRLDKAADPTMQALAEEAFVQYKLRGPELLQPGSWHLPYITAGDSTATMLYLQPDWEQQTGEHAESVPMDAIYELLKKISVARCARVSYNSFETQKLSTIEEDLKLYDRLVGSQPLHASPAEHQATPDSKRDILEFMPMWDNARQHGNFTGWRQFRKMLPNEAVAPLPTGYSL